MVDLLKWLGFKGRPKAVSKPHGWTKTTGPYGEVVHCDTLQCCHCQAHWEVLVGSGRLRGFCSRCMGYTCGQPACMICVPAEVRLENIEAGRPELTPRPELILVPEEPPHDPVLPSND